MKIKIVVLLLCMSVLACKNDNHENASETKSETEIGFDSAKWKTRQGQEFPYRAQMLDDLVQSKKLKGLKKSEVLNLLGEPTRTDKNYMFYEVNRDKIEFFTLRAKTLVLRFSPEDMVEAVLIHG
ncbi:hypothetical protein HUK80_01550 [Flavobacterium sp. MAH-1]|uniref:Lipoprotein SmpA/OmlA domain-containing protein n=1 Tax=Flavobacterium agri TaxID=2743471 RepID=A0A7Y9C5P6_9FLAO|nr:hypothetical protein [Flavobacterium agri]NUY79563.1 hypothetical protein [Flavobacterium agri]NYA69588.1 hypothetical protein [Flavobacterium agri]